QLDVKGSIWNLQSIPDVSGDGIDDALAFEFIDGAGGPDYASLDVIDIANSKVIWNNDIGDGLYKGGALYYAVWITDNNSKNSKPNMAVTERIDDLVQLVLIDGGTGKQLWEFTLGQDNSKSDLIKNYPISRIADL